ncbi:MAG TPA: hypothetical protein QKA14_00955 [Candidatus Megaira endosymbiont of Hartmannula sinica]|nr:hypothetical protein [Candidatus Megaera endosymbiont of Hartmannula sinica]
MILSGNKFSQISKSDGIIITKWHKGSLNNLVKIMISLSDAENGDGIIDVLVLERTKNYHGIWDKGYKYSQSLAEILKKRIITNALQNMKPC